jgi:hypothetical protein
MHPYRSFQYMFYRTFLLITALCGVLLMAGGCADGISVSSNQGTLEVTVVTIPACPGGQAEDNACPAQPVPHQKVLIEKTNGGVVATMTTDSAGHFSYTLPPGNYLLSVQHAAPALIGRRQNTSVTISDGQTTTVRIIIDNGLRRN